jgi:hypothetical protein
MSIVWSFSSLKTFQQCPKKYYHNKILKDIREPDTKATLYGKEMHQVAEDYIRDGKPIPPTFDYIIPTMEMLAAIPGEKHCEVKLGLTRDLRACDFDAPDVWWHGIADLVIINEEKGLAHSIDYKTSKNARYADVKQLDLVAAGIFAKYPKIKKIKSALLFVVSKEFVKADHVAERALEYVAKPTFDVERIEAAIRTNVWNPVQGPLCRFCSVKQCEYNGG